MPSDEDADFAVLFRNFTHIHVQGKAAWEVLYHACYPHVLRYAELRLGPEMRSLYDAADFASDVMLELVRDFDRLEFPSYQALLDYLEQQVERKVRDVRRRQLGHRARTG
jgi:hypothetical protein